MKLTAEAIKAATDASYEKLVGKSMGSIESEFAVNVQKIIDRGEYSFTFTCYEDTKERWNIRVEAFQRVATDLQKRGFQVGKVSVDNDREESCSCVSAKVSW